jgi:DNA-binding NarL/FixJ family response regulator
MDQVVRDCSRANEELGQIASALGAGVILIDSDGQIVWMDERTRRRVNGGMQSLVSSIRRSNGPAIDCFASAVDVTMNGERRLVCVLQKTDDRKEDRRDLIAAIEAVIADTSWFTRTIVDKLKALRQATHSAASSSDLDHLTDREREILGLICEGRSDPEMSTMLNLSQNTVRNHVASMYRKIGVNRRSAAIIWGRERAITSHDALALRARKRPRPDHEQKVSSY